MKKILMLLTVLLVSVSFMGCGKEAKKKKATSMATPVKQTAKLPSAENIIKENKGKVLVLLLGMEGCPGTEKSTKYLSEYIKTKPEGVEVYRIDVPPPNAKALKPVTGLDLKYSVDTSRKLADKMEFFFYPTLYILDKDGTVRFHGECEGKKVEKMVAEMLNEKPGSLKKMYTPALPEIGKTASDFTGNTLDGKKRSLKDISAGSDLNLLLFSKTTCPFSNKAVASLAGLEKQFKGKKLSITIINMGQDADEIKDFYASKTPEKCVVVDNDNAVSTGKFGVSAVPFFYLLDKNLKIVERKPYTAELAKNAMTKALGGNTTGCGTSSSGAG